MTIEFEFDVGPCTGISNAIDRLGRISSAITHQVEVCGAYRVVRPGQGFELRSLGGEDTQR